MSLPFIQLNQGLGQYTIASALSVLQPYSPRVAMQFLDSRGSLWTDTARTTPVANLGYSVRGVTNYVTGQPHGAQSNDARRPTWNSYTVGSATYRGLVFDGTDDQIILTGLNMSDTNRLSVIVGLRKLLDGVDRNVLQLTSGPSIDGAFTVSAPGSGAVARYQGSSRGTTTAIPFTSSTAFNAPHTAQLELTANIATPFARLRVNGTQVSNITTTQGTGNYANSDLFIGLRSAGTEPLNAVLNYIFICGEVIPDSIGDQIRRGFASQTGIPAT